MLLGVYKENCLISIRLELYLVFLPEIPRSLKEISP